MNGRDSNTKYMYGIEKKLTVSERYLIHVGQKSTL